LRFDVTYFIGRLMNDLITGLLIELEDAQLVGIGGKVR
jgi:hypothetical protein